MTRRPNPYLPGLIEKLKARLLEPKPDPEILLFAGVLQILYYREDYPDWVEILANGNPDAFDAVVEAARADLREGESHAS